MPAGAKQSRETARGLRLIASGVPVYTAAARVGVVASTLYRAIKAAAKKAKKRT